MSSIPETRQTQIRDIVTRYGTPAYSYDADVNGLEFDLYAEELAAGYFRGFLWDAWMQSKGPQEAKLIPSWNRVAYVFPEIYDRLLSAVEQDNNME